MYCDPRLAACCSIYNRLSQTSRFVEEMYSAEVNVTVIVQFSGRENLHYQQNLAACRDFTASVGRQPMLHGFPSRDSVGEAGSHILNRPNRLTSGNFAQGPQGGSKPPRLNGWQRRMRHAPRRVPRTTPYFSIAAIMYWLQVGWKRQFEPSSGEIPR